MGWDCFGPDVSSGILSETAEDTYCKLYVMIENTHFKDHMRGLACFSPSHIVYITFCKPCCCVNFNLQPYICRQTSVSIHVISIHILHWFVSYIIIMRWYRADFLNQSALELHYQTTSEQLTKMNVDFILTMMAYKADTSFESLLINPHIVRIMKANGL